MTGLVSNIAMMRQIVRVAWPIALARLGIMSMGVVDTIMVGQLAPTELAWQALGWAPTSIFLVAGIGLLLGVQVLTARLIGEGRPAAVGRVWRLGMGLGLVAGLLACGAIWIFGEQLLLVLGVEPSLAAPASGVMRILALSLPLHLVYVAGAFFLEALKRPVAGSVIMWAANIVNFGLNAWLIPLHGAEGSAWATAGARLFLAVVIVGWIWRLSDHQALGVRGSPDGSAAGIGIGAMLRVGVAAAVSQAAEAGAFSSLTVIAARIGAQAVATYAILLNLLAVVFMVALGIAGASAVLVSEAIGASHRERAGQAAWVGLWLNSAAMLAIGAALWVFARPVAHLYTSDPALILLILAMMGWACAILLPDGGQVVVAATLRARGDNWAPTASHVLAYVGVMPPLAYYWGEVQGQGVEGLMAAIFWASVLSLAILASRQLILFKRG
jgi:multidrug resistance protein, MATE family